MIHDASLSKVVMPDGKEYIILTDCFSHLASQDSIDLYGIAVKNSKHVLKKYFFNNPELVASYFERLYSKPKVVKPLSNLCLYLMRDTRNGLIKIGKSANPKKREKTLQSEVPQIELIFYSESLDYRTSEKFFHKKFNEKRIRGEWFELTQSDVAFITGSFK